jgi:hypothetical protein
VGACGTEIGDKNGPDIPDDIDDDIDLGEPFTYEPSNIPRALLESGTGALTLSGTVTIDTDAGTMTSGTTAVVFPPGVSFQVVNQSGEPSIGVFVLDSLFIDAGAVVRVRGERALAIAAQGDVSIHGTLEASALGARAGSGGFDGGSPGTTADGFGPGGGLSSSEHAGGGGGGFFASGGGGGDGDDGNNDGGIQGAAYGEANLIPLVGGSGGARGGGAGGGAGGGGGGAIQISSRQTILVSATGKIVCAGAGGEGGDTDDGGGGGGAGGAILLEARDLEVLGTLSVNGGGGGAGSPDNQAENGLDGGTLASVRGGRAGSPGSDGGNGGAGGTAAGGAGDPAGDGAGGGGGSGGRIYVRSAVAAKLSGTITPAAASSAGDL